MQARLQHKASELQGLSGREEDLKERLNDLNAFVEVSGQAAALLCELTMQLAVWWCGVQQSTQNGRAAARQDCGTGGFCWGCLGQHSTGTGGHP